jgi:hypothetical protein
VAPVSAVPASELVSARALRSPVQTRPRRSIAVAAVLAAGALIGLVAAVWTTGAGGTFGRVEQTASCAGGRPQLRVAPLEVVDLLSGLAPRNDTALGRAVAHEVVAAFGALGWAGTVSVADGAPGSPAGILEAEGYELRGAFERSASGIRLSAHLVRAEDGWTVWGGTLEAAGDDPAQWRALVVADLVEAVAEMLAPPAKEILAAR